MNYTIKALSYKFIFAAEMTENYQRITLNIIPTFRIELYKKSFSDEYVNAFIIDWIFWSIGVCVKKNLEH